VELLEGEVPSVAHEVHSCLHNRHWDHVHVPSDRDGGSNVGVDEGEEVPVGSSVQGVVRLDDEH